MATYPDALKASTWDKKLKLPSSSKLGDALKALARQHDATEWDRFAGEGLLRTVRTIDTLEAAVKSLASDWRGAAATLKKLTGDIADEIKTARKACAKDKDALASLKTIEEKLIGYAGEVEAVAPALAKARDAAAKVIEQAEKDADDDAPVGGLIDPKKLLAQLMQCRRDPMRRVHFAYVDAAAKKPAVLVVHPTTSAQSLFSKLQTETGVKTGSYGSAWVDGTALRLKIDKAYSGLAKKIRPPLKAAGFKVIDIVILGADDKLLEKDQELDDDKPQAQAQAQAKPKPEDGQQRAEAFKSRATELAEKLKGSRDLSTIQLLKTANEAAKVPDWPRALALLDKVQSALDGPKKTEPVGKGKEPVGSVPKVGGMDAVFAKVLYGGDPRALAPLKQVFDEKALAAMHQAFGGESGLEAVKRILQDVCGGDPKRLRSLVDALG